MQVLDSDEIHAPAILDSHVELMQKIPQIGVSEYLARIETWSPSPRKRESPCKNSHN